MKCLVTMSFMTAKGEIPAGAIVNFPDHLLNRLVGKVEPLYADTYPSADWIPETQRQAINAKCCSCSSGYDTGLGCSVSDVFQSV